MKWFKNNWDVLGEYLLPIIILIATGLLVRFTSMGDGIDGWASLVYIAGALIIGLIVSVIFAGIALYRMFRKNIGGIVKLIFIMIPIVLLIITLWFRQ